MKFIQELLLRNGNVSEASPLRREETYSGAVATQQQRVPNGLCKSGLCTCDEWFSPSTRNVINNDIVTLIKKTN